MAILFLSRQTVPLFTIISFRVKHVQWSGKETIVSCFAQWSSPWQEPITRSVQLPSFRATAFSQVELFLDMPFPLKLLFLVTSASRNLSKNDGGETPLFLLLYSVFHLSSSIIPIHHSLNWSSHNSMRFICTYHMCKWSCSIPLIHFSLCEFFQLSHRFVSFSRAFAMVKETWKKWKDLLWGISN